MTRHRCAGCDRPYLEVILDFGETPLADRFPATATEAEAWYPLQVAVCAGCWLVQLLQVVPDGELFGPDYGFRSSASPSLVAYLSEYASWLRARHHERMQRGVVEIACNDGALLRQLPDYRPLGVDPAAGAVAEAQAEGLDAVCAPFTTALADKLAGERGLVGVVLANNVLAHVADPHDFLAGVERLLTPDGVAVLEVQSLADLIAGNQFDHVYHEHRMFLSLESVRLLAEQHGLGVVAAEHTPAQGGSLRITLARVGATDRVVMGLPDEHRLQLQSMTPYLSMQGRADYLRDRLAGLLAAERSGGRQLAGYGATAKSCTLLNRLPAADLLEYVEDVTPGKVGRYAPGSRIPIVAPGQRGRPDTFLLLAWNYLAGVLRREHEFTDAGGRWLVPTPYPVIL